MPKDLIYSNPKNPLGVFKFDETVANVFPDMLHRSIPGYELVLSMIRIFSGLYKEENRNYYDLGCSLGAAAIAMAKALNLKKAQIIAVDNSEAMIKKCQENIKKAALKIPVNLKCADVLDIEIINAKIVILNFTLQFINKEKRTEILKNIYNGLVNGGVLILSEKISFSDIVEKEYNEFLYVEFKKANGYSDLEISQKRTALENVLLPDTIKEHLERLEACGFKKSYVWYQCINFASIVAFK
ncbi:MAG: carboxy-S-adenosyl-L-methionine synthase CmoA [Calditrichaceae bacterium]|nr:carboxy-S-adenosyl-L-methionine synthase CmoA [Calditrichaceae bacterium]HES58805.1 carboxy-S-adenosyl-L-methionine synthase CmoA [Caldithrix sp.]